jgi:hypothetical protein
MPTQIVYLHIPKSGGTSQRMAFYDIYGEDKVFWHGLDNDAGTDQYDEDQLKPFTVVGGHKPIEFYPQNPDALFISIVREPVIRAVSLYSYYAKPDFAEPHFVSTRRKLFQTWQDRGMDSDSLVNSLQRCPEFRREVENQQCRYLSRYGNTFQGVMQTLGEVTAVIGEMDSTATMNTYLSGFMNWGHVRQRKANASLEDTHSFILQEAGAEEALGELLKEDLKLYRFIKDEHQGLYSNAPKKMHWRHLMRPSAPLEENTTEEHWKKIQLYSKGFLGLQSDGSGSLGIVIINHSSVDIDCRQYPELAITYNAFDRSGAELGGQVFSQPMQVPLKAHGKLVLSLEVKLPPELLPDAAGIRVRLAISPSQPLTQFNPLHLASAQIFHV